MKKNYKTKQMTEETSQNKDVKFPFSFKGNPPMTIWAKDIEEARKEFKKLKANKK